MTSYPAETTDFAERLQAIINTPVTVENISNYPDEAIEQFVALSGLVRAAYAENVEPGETSDRQLEDEAFKTYGLPPVQETLTVLQEKISLVWKAGGLMTGAVEIDTVITPPDTKQHPVTSNGKERFSPAGLKDRVQTALYLINSMGIEVTPEQIVKGVIDPNMMRRTSYYTIDVPELDRVVNLCDEERNTSYVFTRSELEKVGVSLEQLNAMTKLQKKELMYLHQKRNLGLSFKYGLEWEQRLVTHLVSETLDVPLISHPGEAPADGKVPIATPTDLSVSGFAKKKHVGVPLIQELIAREKLTLPLMLFSPRTVPGLSEVAQDFLESLPELDFVLPDNTVRSVKKYAVQIGMARDGLVELIEKHGIPTRNYKFGSQIAPGLPEESQHLVDEVFNDLLPVADETIASASTLAIERHVDYKKLIALAEECGLKPGPYRFKGRPGTGLTEEEVAILDQHPFLQIPVADDSVESVSSLHRRLHSSNGTIRKYFERLGIEPKRHRFGSQAADSITVEEASAAESLLRSERRLDEDLTSVDSVRVGYGLTPRVMRRIMAENEIETVQGFFTTVPAEALAPGMKQKLVAAIEAYKQTDGSTKA